ncbi:hypothetical protein Y032_0036g3193 [Ancylostoma ceylanicum]|uniref:Uncharacterized protein n=1 Tax=Ancylostoma ceylanicum TaxID=53326 RepID=A0A016ULZ0_9BILA|nr:hypothetical protein Y032_0036g3193 [Ancylostoma ceylanicum]
MTLFDASLLRYSKLQTVADKGRGRGVVTLVLCCTEAADLLVRDTEENRAAVPTLVYDRLELTVKYVHNSV